MHQETGQVNEQYECHLLRQNTRWEYVWQRVHLEMRDLRVAQTRETERNASLTRELEQLLVQFRELEGNRDFVVHKLISAITKVSKQAKKIKKVTTANARLKALYDIYQAAEERDEGRSPDPLLPEEETMGHED